MSFLFEMVNYYNVIYNNELSSVNITLRRSRLSGLVRATSPD